MRLPERVYWSPAYARALRAAVVALAPVARRSLDRCVDHAERVARVPALVPGGAGQVPSEIAAFLDFVEQRSPARILEVGVAAGGTSVLLARAASSVRTVIGVDLRLQNVRVLHALAPPQVQLHLIEGSSRDVLVVDRVRRALGGASLDVAFIDGDHSYDGAMGDYLLYRDLVRPGGLIAFHDIVPDSAMRGGPPSWSWVGDVPKVWDAVKADNARHWEFVESWNQDGRGIGVIEVT